MEKILTGFIVLIALFSVGCTGSDLTSESVSCLYGSSENVSDNYVSEETKDESSSENEDSDLDDSSSDKVNNQDWTLIY